MVVPKISIITINFNNAKGLYKTMQSVFTQSNAVYNYVIIDGGSSDDSLELIKEHGDKITYWVSESDSGVFNAQNKGWRSTSTDYYLFLNSGDTFCDENSLYSLITAINGAEDLVYGDIHLVYPGGYEEEVKMPDLLTMQFLTEAALTHPTTLISRRILEKLDGFNEQYRIISDWVFFYKAVLLHNASYKHIHKTLVRFMKNGMSSKMGNAQRIWNEKQIFFETEVSGPVKEVYQKMLSSQQILRKMQASPGFVIFQSILSFSSKIHFQRIRFRRWIDSYSSFCKRHNHLEFKKIPIVINSRNRCSYLMRLISRLEDMGYYNIHIIDNNSTLPELLEYYSKLPYSIYRLKENIGYCALWDVEEIWQQFEGDFYVYTDSDVCPDSNCPPDFMRLFYYLLTKYPEKNKVGFSLRIDNIPGEIEAREKILNWEKKYWLQKIDKYAYHAQIDTTFALYRPGAKGPAVCTSALRTASPYSALHLPWYGVKCCSEDESKFYLKTANQDVTWGPDGSAQFQN